MVLLNLLWALTGLASAALFYASMPHQRLLPVWAKRGVLRTAGSVVFAISLVLAIWALGLWSGIFASLTALMFGCVVLPYVNAWPSKQESVDVG